MHFLKYSYVDAHEQMAELVEKLLGLDPTSEFGLVEMLELYKLSKGDFSESYSKKTLNSNAVSFS